MRNVFMKNLAATLWGIWRRRYLIAVPVLLMPVLGLLIGLFSPKQYESYTTILIQETAKQNPFLEDLAVATNLKSRMEALNALLHSRHILAEVAFKMGLIGEEMPEKERSRNIATLSKALDATLVGDDLVKIHYTADNPDGMAEVLKLVSFLFVERVMAPQRSSIRSSEAFLKKELERRRVELLAAEQKLADYRSKFAGELPELHANNVVRLGNLRDILAERGTQLKGAQAAQEILRKRLSQTNPVVGRLEEVIVDSLSDLAILRGRYTDKHTKVQAALRKLKSLEVERSKALRAGDHFGSADLDRLWNLASSSSVTSENGAQPMLVSQLQRLQEGTTRIRSLEEEVASLEKEVMALNAKVSGFGEHELRLGELKRDISVKRTIFEDLAERHQKARVTGALGKFEESERVKLIDPPFTPVAPSNLPIILFVVAGLIGGIGLGAGLAAAAELIDTSLRLRDTLADLTGAPVFSRIPVLPDDGYGADGEGIDPGIFTAARMEGLSHA